ncbi:MULTISPECIES: TfuA-like protein [unclassified Rhizobium]|uniref:TfuA-like protein n=1 Tax=unclassified Rhizobium TaxID=2613769 RepID=UPI0007EB2198|nr:MULTISPECIES: TfuA-like protein [unclassified Rhizobium]ANK89513.1 TfuA-like domain-containing protein [Rhizobium sp. N731]ANL19765.1 TfuA-like domain-containing protein [Rhizobium sp. N1314]
MKVLFVGPSLGGGLAAARNMSPCIDFRPPAARGDILKAVEDGATAIGLVDGYFGDLPSVWHKEILYALEHEVAIAGGASMGALRAAECAPFGMVGLGSIFKDYDSGRLLDDEAVALVHAPQALGWLPLSVPWVDFEPTIDALYACGEISTGERKKLLLSGRFLHFSERTYARVVDECHFRKPRRDHLLAALRKNRVERKRDDARLVLEWLHRDEFAPVNRDWRFAATSHWELLHAEVTRNVTPVTLE